MSLLFIFLTAVACQKPVEREECLQRTYEHEYGLPVEEKQWEGCGKNGKVNSTLRNGVTISQNYQNGLLHGESTFTFPHSSQIERVEGYSGGTLISQVFYSPAGNPIRSESYASPNTRVITDWYEQGNPRSVETYDGLFLVSGEYYSLQNQCEGKIYNGTGERPRRNEIGDFVSNDYFQDGKLCQVSTFYSNGSPKEISSIMNDVLHGERKTYYVGGEPMAIENWENGSRSGVTIIFQNGEKYAEVPYKGNLKNGVEKRFRDGSIITDEITWVNDVKHGPCTTIYGDMTDTVWYYKGRLSSKANFESFALPRNYQ
jgi:antitoxin component YwqK of YwqJK toxin-antitoxin module